MQNCHKAFGARISVRGVPADSAPGGDEGSIRIECENYSMVPVDVVLRKLLSSNPEVAEADGIAHKTVYLGRRRSISHLDQLAAMTDTDQHADDEDVQNKCVRVRRRPEWELRREDPHEHGRVADRKGGGSNEVERHARGQS